MRSLLEFISQKKEKILRMSLGLLLVLATSSLLFIQAKPLDVWITALEHFEYDLQVQHMHKPLSKNTPITIVDIDDKSLKAEGRWPWPRKKVAELVTKLFKEGATVVAFDITFPDPEENIVEEVIQEIKKNSIPSTLTDLNKVKEEFDYDSQLAKSLTLGDAVLGMVFTSQKLETGELPKPLLQLNPLLMSQLAIPEEMGYLANIPILQESAKTAGFINAKPDSDGVLRSTPLLLRQGSNVYGSLALQAVALYLLSQKIELLTAQYEGKATLEGIQLDHRSIPVNAKGEMLIPFRGPPFSFPYVSAVDLLNNKTPKEALSGKIIFIGSTASATQDNRPASIDPIFPGIEVHASVASGIIDQYFPYRPVWGRGVTLLVILTLGTLYAVILPFSGLLTLSLLCIPIPIALVFLNQWLWKEYSLVISIILPIALLLILFVINIIEGYLFESLRSRKIKSIFAQYVPPAYLDNMLKKGEEFSLDGETKELTVLFSDIRSFTNLSEKMTATELKQFLNRYFNSITEIIFKNNGTIDKYVGDMVMAFWGAPLSDDKHSIHAVSTALAMQEGLSILNATFLREQKPQIKIGIGVNTGIMNVGDMGSSFRRSYTVLGDTVNLASRLEGQTKLYHIDILVGELTYLQTKDHFAYRKIDKIKVKGKDKAVEVFTPICRNEESTPEIERELEKHNEALDAYFNQNWEISQTLFKQLQETYPHNEALYEIYLSRIEQLLKKTPGPNWDGAFVCLEK